MKRLPPLWSVAFLCAARAAAQETPAENLVRIWLDDPMPALEQRVLELGPEAVAPLLLRLGIGPEETEEGTNPETEDPAQAATRLRVLATLARLQQHGAAAFPRLARAVRKQPVPKRAPYYEALAALAPWRAATDALWQKREEHALASLLAVPEPGAEWTREGTLLVQRTAARCWGRPASSLDDLARQLDGRSPWRVQLAIEALAREAATQPERVRTVVPRLRAIVARPDPRLLFTTQRVPLRANAARLLLALDSGTEDAKALRGVLLGEPPAAPPEDSKHVASAPTLRATLAAIADQATRADAMAQLEALGDDALPGLAAALDNKTPPIAMREALRLLRSRAPRASTSLPHLLDAIGKVDAPQQHSLLHTIASLLPWSRDRMPWIHQRRSRSFFADEQQLSIAVDPENAESVRLLGMASIADGECSFEELRDLLISEDYLQREVGVRIAVARPDDLKRLTKEVLVCLDPKRRPVPAVPGFAILLRSSFENFDQHVARIAELVAAVADADSELALATAQLVEAEPHESTPTEDATKQPTTGAEPTAAAPERDDSPMPQRTASPRERECRDLVARLGTGDSEPARRGLLALGPDAARVLADGLDEDEPLDRTAQRLELLAQLGAQAGAEFDAVQAAAQRHPLRLPVEFARTVAELAPFRPASSELDFGMPFYVRERDGIADAQSVNVELARIAVRARTRADVRATDDVNLHLARLNSHRAFVVEAAIDCLAKRGAAAAPAIPALRERTRQSDPRILRTDRTVPLREKAAAAILAIDPTVPFAEELRRPFDQPTRRPPPERVLARASELLLELDDAERRAGARENLLLLGPLCAPAVAEFVVANAQRSASFEAVDVLLEGSWDTTQVTARLVDALATAAPADRLRLAILLALVAPRSRDVVVPPHHDGVSSLWLGEVDLMQGLAKRSRSTLHFIAEDIDGCLSFDPEAPASVIETQLDSNSFPLSLHALLAIRLRPGEFAEAALRLRRELESVAHNTRFGVMLDEASVTCLTRRCHSAAAEALLAQVAPESPDAERARAVLERMRSGAPK